MTKRNQPRPPKKTQTIELRVSEGEKAAFLEACRIAGRSASEALRRMMTIFVTVQQLRRRCETMVKLNFLRPAGAAMAMSAVAVTAGISILFAPVANAEAQLSYRLVVDDGVGEIISQGQAELDAKAPIKPVADSLGNTVQFELRAQSCALREHPACPPGHVFVEIDIWSLSEQGERDKIMTSLTVREGEVARFEKPLQDGLKLTGVLAPRSDS